jgi:hypothetical protein
MAQFVAAAKLPQNAITQTSAALGVEAVEKPQKKVKSAGQNGCTTHYAKFHSLQSQSIRNGGD